ncbi:unnamed protein product [Tilletia controversa]|nr:unnamed protein product [Tilletia controversa]
MPNLCLPIDLNIKGRLYCVHANHRGDMYHIRAARTIAPGPLLIHSCKAGPPGDLELYLDAVEDHGNDDMKVVRTSMTWEELGDLGKFPKDFTLMMNGVPILDVAQLKKTDFTSVGEGDCTTIVTNYVANPPPEPPSLLGTTLGMLKFDLDDGGKNALRTWVDIKVANVFNAGGFQAGTLGILMLHRGTGTGGNDVDAPYPENDTDPETCKAICEAIRKATNEDKFALAGNSPNDGGYGGIPSIGRWFVDMGFSANVQIEGLTAAQVGGLRSRDVETLFMWRAYELEYYSLVVGFRSGALDMFTFLGIPTVSIALEKLIGNARMMKIKAHAFRRTNVTYPKARQAATRLKNRKNGGSANASPCWDDRFAAGLIGNQVSEPAPAQRQEYRKRAPEPMDAVGSKAIMDEVLKFL